MLMYVKTMLTAVALLLLTTSIAIGQSLPARERICGKWESVAKDLVINIFLQGNEFKAKIIWYADTEGKPLDYWTDVHNPNPALRSRKILGMSILRNLKYAPQSDSWENGMVYDSRHGKEWNASATIGRHGRLHVRGYWHFKFIGRTMNFYRVK